MIYLILSFALACADENKIICNTICVQDSDELGIIINGQCYCGNKREIKKVPTKINRNFKVETFTNEKKQSYDE